MSSSLFIHCNPPVAADPTLFIEDIDLRISTAQLRNVIFRTQNLKDVVRGPAELLLYRYNKEGNHQGDLLDLKKTLSEQNIATNGELYMFANLVGV